MPAAKARFELAVAGYTRVRDRNVIRIALHRSLLHVLPPEPALQPVMPAVLLPVPGVTEVQLHTG
jgi:hypothetical protein